MRVLLTLAALLVAAPQSAVTSAAGTDLADEMRGRSLRAKAAERAALGSRLLAGATADPKSPQADLNQTVYGTVKNT